MNRFLPYRVLCTLLIACVTAGFIFYHAGHKSYEIENTAHHIEEKFIALQQQIVHTISDEELVSKLLTDSYTFEEFKKITDYPFGVVVYENDTAVMWTNNMITPVQAQPGQDDIPLYITEANGSYVVCKHNFKNSSVSTIGFLPLRFGYGIKNQYLDDIHTQGIYIPHYYSISAKPSDGAYAIHDSNGETIFFINYTPGEDATTHFNIWFYISLACDLILVIILLFMLCGVLARRLNRTAAVFIYLVFLTLLQILSDHFLQRRFFNYTALFDPQYYGSAGIAGSIGDLLIKTALFFAGACFILKYLRINTRKYNILIASACFMFFLLSGRLVLYIFQGLLFDSAISFDIHNFFSLTYFSLAGMLCISAGLLAYLLISVQLLSYAMQPLYLNKMVPALAGGIAAYTCIILLAGYKWDWQAVIFCGGIYCVRYFLLQRRIPLRSFSSVITWLFFFSAFSAYVFSTILSRKQEENKKLFALKKAVEKDAITEYLFGDIENDLTRALTLQLAVHDTSRVKQSILNQVRQDLQNNYLKKYENDIFIFDRDSLILTNDKERSEKRNYFIDAIENNGEFTAAQNLYFINDNTGNYYYLAELPLHKDSLHAETAYIRLVPKRISNQRLYPELLIDDELKTPASFSGFDYAIYNDHSLIEREGEFSYPIMDVFYVNKDEEFVKQDVDGFRHLVYRVNENKKVVVSQPKDSVIEPLSYFSYIFFFYLLFLLAILGIDLMIKIVRRKIKLNAWLNTSLQNKIQVSVISLIVFAFLIMGIATIIYITNQYNKSHKQRLLTKIEAVQTNIDYIFDDVRKKGNENGKTGSPQLMRRITNRASELSEIHDMDINLYSPDGELITSSQPDIFTRGLVSTKMNPLAYFKMSCDKETWYIQDEMIGRLKYLSAYVPIMDNYGEVLFYLNLPYFATEQNLRAEISSFMVALINVYVLLLVIAAFLALAVAQSITKPLAVITGTFKNIKLGKSNARIDWKHDDEIGLLVDEYNNMLKELELSASLLAKSERESAWRDMAKQVAHEIKNPLTPMRLSIQHLQRALKANAGNITELTQKVTQTLLEQIDNLSFIASEFSNFAIMPKANNEELCLNSILDNVAHLFMENEEAEIEVSIPQDDIYIFADKNQLIRVFNNIIKNAIQSIPEDQEGKISITLNRNEQRAIVKITDNGIGIPEEQKEKVFVPNFTTKSSGMGIGLSMSKNIIESLGGYIWFESEINRGTSFYIEFPVYEN